MVLHKHYTFWAILKGDKVNLWIRTYPHKPEEDEVAIYNNQSDHPFWDLQAYRKQQVWTGHTWHQMSLLRPGVIKEHETEIAIETFWALGMSRGMQYMKYALLNNDL